MESSSFSQSELSTPLTGGGKEAKKEKRVNFSKSSMLSYIFFFWSRFAIQLANKTRLKTSDVCALTETQTTRYHLGYLKQRWKKYSPYKKSLPLIKAIFTNHMGKVALLFFLDISLMLIDYVRMYFFRQIILHFSHSSNYYFTLSHSLLGLILCKIYTTIAFHHLDFNNCLLSERITNEITALIYGKILKCNTNASENAKEEGEKLNLIEVDVEKIGFVFFIGPRLITAPFRVLFSVYLLYKLFGFLFVYSVAILSVCVVIVFFVQAEFLSNFKKLLVAKDDRMKIVTQTFNIIKSIKLNGWDDAFERKINEKRENELSIFNKNLNLSLARQLINSNLPLVMLVIAIGAVILVGDMVEISNLFTAIQLINSISIPIMFIPLHITEFFQNLICINRIQKFLYGVEHNFEEPKTDEKYSVKYENATFGVNKVDDELGYEDKGEMKVNKVVMLKDINLEIEKGQFIGIIGTTGSGKSNLLNSFLNNFECFSSDSPVILPKNISYASQQPWIMNDTIKNNIVFYNDFNQERYDTVINACQLKEDLQILPHGDETEISSNGNNVSGGQRARIALARCLYREADFYILDDPLSSIDTKVSKCIFLEAFCGFLKGKTIILATNELPNLSNVDKVILMESLSIKFFGNYNEFQSLHGNDFLGDHKNTVNTHEEPKEEQEKPSAGKTGLASEIGIIKQKKQGDGKLTQKEKSQTGAISMKIYNSYIKMSGGYTLFMIYILAIIGSHVVRVWREIFISSWSKNYDKSDSYDDHKESFFFYLKISISGVFLNFLIDFITTKTRIKVTRKLHFQMISRLIKAPINLFHDVVPIGQILNRLTKDLDLIQNLIGSISMFLRSNFGLISSVYVCYMYNKYSLILAPILCVVSFALTNYYISAARNLQRLHRVSYSPIITIISETIRGVETIRAGKAEEFLKDKIYRRLDDHYGVHIFIEGTEKYYNVFLSIISHTFFGFVIGYIIYNKEHFSAQAIGLILQYSAMLNDQVVGLMRAYSEIEVSMVCLERCEAYTKIPTEKYKGRIEQIEEKKMQWPLKGKIEFKNYSLRYRDNTPVVLKDLNLVINAGDRVGIVGRTGSGKSSMIMGLCRLIEAKTGSIEIDGVDISKIDLNTLRQRITIVPQEPFLVEGTLKENIDPLNKCRDEDILEVLNEFGLFSQEPTKDKLNIMIKENGANLSIGEKQLICFVRAVMKKSKIVVLDEATASIDVQTEKVLKKNLGKYFKDCTLIMIAHHIQMVSGCNRIVVIDKGSVVENDTYQNLLQNQKSIFYELYSESLSA